MPDVLQFNGQEPFEHRMNGMMISKVTCSMCAALESFVFRRCSNGGTWLWRESDWNIKRGNFSLLACVLKVRRNHSDPPGPPWMAKQPWDYHTHKRSPATWRTSCYIIYCFGSPMHIQNAERVARKNWTSAYLHFSTVEKLERRKRAQPAVQAADQQKLFSLQFWTPNPAEPAPPEQK